MNRIMLDVAAFHAACDVPVLRTPQIPPPDRKALRIKLIREEVVEELLPAMERDDLPEIADAMADSVYVIAGGALEYGIPLARVWELVQKANMAKVDPATGKVRRRDDGKILKPDGWTPPNVEGLLAEVDNPAITVLAPEPLEQLLLELRGVFLEYAKNHQAKGNEEKMQSNIGLANKITHALRTY